MNQARLYLILIAAVLCTTYANTQKTFDDIKYDTIQFEGLNENYKKSIALFEGDEIDSIDILILQNPMIVVQLMTTLTGSEKITYNDFKSYYLGIKNNTNVQRLRIYYKTLPFLKETIVNHANWENDQQMIKRLIKDRQQLQSIERYVRDYTDSSVTYIQLFAIMERDSQRKEPKGLNKLLEEFSIANIDSLLSESKAENKPILLYFSGHNVVNARKLEMRVMNKQTIIDQLQNDFIFVNLLVDDRTEIPNEDHYYSDRLDKKVTTVGAFNMDYQLKRFEVNRQPFLVVLNSQNEVLGTRKYQELKTSVDMELFLEEMLKGYNE